MGHGVLIQCCGNIKMNRTPTKKVFPFLIIPVVRSLKWIKWNDYFSISVYDLSHWYQMSASYSEGGDIRNKELAIFPSVFCNLILRGSLVLLRNLMCSLFLLFTWYSKDKMNYFTLEFWQIISFLNVVYLFFSTICYMLGTQNAKLNKISSLRDDTFVKIIVKNAFIHLFT